MPIWRLLPVDLADPNWEASSHRGAALVRAPSEETAREAAQKALGLKIGYPIGRGITAPPWKRSQLVRAELTHDDRYDPEGPTEVLEPSFATDLHSEPRKT